jgi:hypothetical protein
MTSCYDRKTHFVKRLLHAQATGYWPRSVMCSFVRLALRCAVRNVLCPASLAAAGKPLNLAVELCRAGLARLQPGMDPSRVSGGTEVAAAIRAAKDARLKVRTHTKSHFIGGHACIMCLQRHTGSQGREAQRCAHSQF